MRWCWVWCLCILAETKGQSIGFKSIFPYGIAGLIKSQEFPIREGVGSAVGLKKPAMACAMENRFSLKELSAMRIAAMIPIQKGIGKIDLQSFGSSLYREHKMVLGYGLSISKTFRIGIEMGGVTYATKESHSGIFLQSGIDFIYEISTKSKLGFQFQQSNALGKMEKGIKLQRFQTQVGHQVNDFLFVGLESIKESGGHLVTGNFLKWDLTKKVSLWGYLNYSNAEIMIGGQMPVGSYAYSLSMSSHPQLGYSLHLMVTYAKKKS